MRPKTAASSRFRARGVGAVGERVHHRLGGVDGNLVPDCPDRHAEQEIRNVGEECGVRRPGRGGLRVGEVRQDRGNQFLDAFDRDAPGAAVLAVERLQRVEAAAGAVECVARSGEAASARSRKAGSRANSAEVAACPSSPNAIFLISMGKNWGDSGKPYRKEVAKDGFCYNFNCFLKPSGVWTTSTCTTTRRPPTAC